MSRLRLGILGAGGIARHFASASPEFKSVDIVAIGSRDLEKAKSFAQKHSIERAWGSYDAVVNDSGVDAVYIALPNGLHKEWALKSARSGKHVLCEKPMALTRSDALEMFDEAEKNSVVLIEGFPLRFQPQTLEVLRRVREGELGKIISFTGCFGFRMRDPNNVRLDPAQGAGAMWDVGVYPLNLARAVMGELPQSVLATSKLNENGVDLTTCAILNYSDGRQASIWSSFESTTFRRANIVGTEGAIDYCHNNHPLTPEAATYLLQAADGSEQRIECEQGNGFVREADAFADLILDSSKPFSGTSRQETLDNIVTVEAIHRSARTNGLVRVS